MTRFPGRSSVGVAPAVGVAAVVVLLLCGGVGSGNAQGRGMPAESRWVGAPLALTVLRVVSVGAPGNLLYDPVNGDLYTVNTRSGDLLVLSGLNGHLIATLTGFAGAASAGGAGWGCRASCMALDPRTGDVFVPNGSTIRILSPANRVVGTIYDWRYAEAAAYDPGTNELYVVNAERPVITVYSVAHRTLVAVIHVPVQTGGTYSTTFTGIAYDAGTGDLLAESSWYSWSSAAGQAWTSVIDPHTHAIVSYGLEDRGEGGWGTVVPSLQRIYALNNLWGLGAPTLVESNASSGHPLNQTLAPHGSAGTNGASVTQLAYDAARHLLVTVSTDTTFGYLTVFRASTGTLVSWIRVGVDPNAVVVDTTTGKLWVADQAMNELFEFSP